jgi:hypothetical protein
MVGSEHLNVKIDLNEVIRVAVPSWSGRNRISRRAELFAGLSPSPHGRVGTWVVRFADDLKPESPSPHGRVGTSIPPRPAVIMTASPSPHGRVGTCCCRPSSECPERNRRPLMVGSELGQPYAASHKHHRIAVPSWSGRNPGLRECAP